MAATLRPTLTSHKIGALGRVPYVSDMIWKGVTQMILNFTRSANSSFSRMFRHIRLSQNNITASISQNTNHFLGGVAVLLSSFAFYNFASVRRVVFLFFRPRLHLALCKVLVPGGMKLSLLSSSFRNQPGPVAHERSTLVMERNEHVVNRSRAGFTKKSNMYQA